MNPREVIFEEMKRECLKMYVNGLGFRAIERVKKVDHTTIMNWVKPETLNPVIKLYIDKHNTPITSNFKLNRQSSGTKNVKVSKAG